LKLKLYSKQDPIKDQVFLLVVFDLNERASFSIGMCRAPKTRLMESILSFEKLNPIDTNWFVEQNLIAYYQFNNSKAVIREIYPFFYNNLDPKVQLEVETCTLNAYSDMLHAN
jgi:hypothetical protein